MIYLLAVIAGIVGAVLGWFVTSVVALWIAGLYGMSDFEGGRGMFAFLGVGPIGGLIAMVISVWWVLRLGTEPATGGRTAARTLIVLAGIAVLIGGGIWVRLQTLDTYSNELPPTLELEIAVANGLPLPEPSELRLELHTDKNVGQGILSGGWVPSNNGRQVIAGTVSLDFKTSSRLLVVAWPGQPVRLFRLSLSRDPSSRASLGDWRRPDHVHVAGEDNPRPAPKDDPVEVRYRVRRAGED